jgi:hypothetical protein
MFKRKGSMKTAIVLVVLVNLPPFSLPYVIWNEPSTLFSLLLMDTRQNRNISTARNREIITY